MPERIKLSRARGWRKPEGAKNVARPSRYGNPFCVDGSSVVGQNWTLVRANWGRQTFREYDVIYTSHSTVAAAVAHSVELFRMLCEVSRRDHPGRFEDWIAPLRGMDLCCWCPLPVPGEPDICHARILLDIANG
jgi:hypothetical protein